MLKDLIKEGGLYTIANLVTRGVSLLLIPIYTIYFSPSDYGIIDILVVFGAFFNAIISLQLSQGLGRYVGDSKIKEKEKINYASSAIFLTIISYSVFGLATFFFADNFIDLLSSDVRIENSIFYLALSSIIINGIFYCLGVYFRFLRKTKTFTAISFIHATSNILITLLLVLGLDFGISGIFIASLIVAPILIVLQFYLLRKHLKIFIGKKEISQIIHYSLPLIPAALAYSILAFTDRLFINEYLNSASVGIYGIGAKFASIIALIIAGFSMALNPIIFDKHDEKDSPEELSKIFGLFVAIGISGVLVLSIFSYETLYIFTQVEYFGAYQIMPILYTSVFFTGIWMFSPGLSIYKKTKITALIVVVSSLLNVVLNYFLMKEFALVGAAMATLISTALNNIFLFYWSNKYYKVSFNLSKIVLIGIVFSITLFIGSYWVYSIDLSNFAFYTIKLACLLVFLVFIFATGIINPIYIHKIKSRFSK